MARHSPDCAPLCFGSLDAVFQQVLVQGWIDESTGPRSRSFRDDGRAGRILATIGLDLPSRPGNLDHHGHGGRYRNGCGRPDSARGRSQDSRSDSACRRLGLPVRGSSPQRSPAYRRRGARRRASTDRPADDSAARARGSAAPADGTDAAGQRLSRSRFLRRRRRALLYRVLRRGRALSRLGFAAAPTRLGLRLWPGDEVFPARPPGSRGPRRRHRLRGDRMVRRQPRRGEFPRYPAAAADGLSRRLLPAGDRLLGVLAPEPQAAARLARGDAPDDRSGRTLPGLGARSLRGSLLFSAVRPVPGILLVPAQKPVRHPGGRLPRRGRGSGARGSGTRRLLSWNLPVSRMDPPRVVRTFPRAGDRRRGMQNYQDLVILERR